MVADLTAEFWQARMKTLVSSTKNKTKKEKIDYVYQGEHITITSLMRIFSIAYPKAETIINELLSRQIIQREKNGYQIKLRTELRNYLSQKV